MAQFIEQFGGWIVGAAAVIGTFLYNRSKIEIDESALVLAKWKELAAQMDAMAIRHETEMRELRAELRAERDENAKLRKRVQELEDQVVGLKRAIAQNSKSAAYHLLRGSGVPSDEDVEAIDRLNRAGDNSIGKGHEE